MSHQNSQVVAAFLKCLALQLGEGVDKIGHCLRQLDEEQVWWRPTAQQNSIANLILHLEGNVRQWIVSGVGGEPDVRDRPREFAERGPMAKRELFERLTQTVERAVEIILSQSAETALERRRVQAFETTVAGAIVDSVAHFRGHVQEIISLSRQQLQERYEFHFVPRSAEQGA